MGGDIVDRQANTLDASLSDDPGISSFPMARHPIPTWFYVLVAARKGKKWLLVQEQDRSWYLPAGQVEPGEILEAAAQRETREEAGLAIKLDGVVRVEHSPLPDGIARCRVIFLGHPIGGKRIKRIPDRESLRAAWFSLSEIAALDLRSPDALELLTYLSGNPPIAPMSILTDEGAPYHALPGGSARRRVSP